jgi:hypothetical protein
MVFPKYRAFISTFSVHVWNKNHMNACFWTLHLRVVARINLRRRIKRSMNSSAGKYLQVADSSGRDFVLTPAVERKTDPTMVSRTSETVCILSGHMFYLLGNVRTA